MKTLTAILFALSFLPLARAEKDYNVLFIISDDLTYTALSCYGNEVCQTPNIDSLATRGTLFTLSLIHISEPTRR